MRKQPVRGSIIWPPGRSVDSGKIRAGQLQPAYNADQAEAFPEEVDSGNSVFTWVSARDIIALLSPQLLPRKKRCSTVLLMDWGIVRFGRKLKMSHTMVIKRARLSNPSEQPP